jgi:hypothetical protein
VLQQFHPVKGAIPEPRPRTLTTADFLLRPLASTSEMTVDESFKIA